MEPDYTLDRGLGKTLSSPDTGLSVGYLKQLWSDFDGLFWADTGWVNEGHVELLEVIVIHKTGMDQSTSQR